MTDLVTIFYEIDNFCKEFESQIKIGNKKRNRSMSITMSEVMTISIWYHKQDIPHLKIITQNMFENI